MVGTTLIHLYCISNLTAIEGSLARVGPNELITDDPEVLRRMMAARSEYTRGHCRRTLF
jgi:hypothetical protein